MNRSHHCLQYTRHWMVHIVMSFLLVIWILTACGYQLTTGSQQKTPSTQTIKCGNVQRGHGEITPSEKTGNQKAVQCFYQAYQHCQSATLVFTAFDVDAGTIHHFSVKNVQERCIISDYEQHYIAPRPPTGATTYSCSTMVMQSDGLHVQKCGALGTIIIPVS